MTTTTTYDFHYPGLTQCCVETLRSSKPQVTDKGCVKCSCGTLLQYNLATGWRPTLPTQPAHTPTPWSVNKSKAYDDGRGFIVWGPKGVGFGSVCRTFREGLIPSEDEAKRCEQNAAFIVRAVNNHDKLVAVLREELEAIRVWQSMSGYEWRIPSDLREGLAISATKIDAALAELGE